MASKRGRNVTNIDDGDCSAAKRPKTTDANSSITTSTVTPNASLLGLPAELRNRIYEYIFGDRTIHITTRPCKPYDKGAFRSNSAPSTWIPHSRSWKKWTHTVCQVPSDWSHSYGLSKLTGDVPEDCYDETGTLVEWHHQGILHDYHTRHDDCNWIQDDFQDRNYNIACSHIEKWCHVPHNCEEQQQYRQNMEAKYGPPATGLEILHSASRLDLKLLPVCRQIYKEAAMLPYASNVFTFDYPTTLLDFVSLALTPAQVASIRNLQAVSWPLEDLNQAAASLPGLRYLQYNDTFPSTSIIHVYLRNGGMQRPRLDKVEVVLGNDYQKPLTTRSRRMRRERAAEIEAALTAGRDSRCGAS